MTVAKKSDKRVRKEAYWHRLQDVVGKHKNVLFVDVDNVSSKQIGQIRKELRDIGATMIVGKNTLMKASLSSADKKIDDENWENNSNIPLIISQLNGNTNLIFTNGDLGDVKDVLDEQVRPSPAKAGMIAPDDVYVPAGPTRLDPKKTAFFQKLQIQTKIVKAQIEIVTTKLVIKKGDKIDFTQAALLDLLKINPFTYKMNVKKVLQDGKLFEPSFLELSVDDVLLKFKRAVDIQASLSLASGVASSASAPHSVLNGFKNLLCAALESGYQFAEADKVLVELMASERATLKSKDEDIGNDLVAEFIERVEVDQFEMTGLFDDTDDEYY